jgi:ADP-ribose pyrophosphatase YjhB (NUDIX family)
MPRAVRYQGAIVRDHHLLLIKHRHHADGRDYWIVPGGGIEDGETEAQCVRREMLEETHLEVRVERLLLDEAADMIGVYSRYKTYLCAPLSGEARPGHEPEPEAAVYSISDIGWFDLRDEAQWDKQVLSDSITYPLVKRIQRALGYDSTR